MHTPPASPDRVARAGVGARLRWAAGAARLTLRDPRDGFDRVLTRSSRLIRPGGALSHEHETDPDWERKLHERLGLPWPCEATSEYDALWAEITGSFESRELTMGRGAYGGWDDGDRGLARGVFCLTRHLRVQRAVETGVARGITSRVILEGLERNGSGHLHSIDLPALDSTIHTEVGAAVPAELRERWSYLSGTSRRRLPALLAELGTIDLFVHDSSHTTRNLRFELEQAWGAIEEGAIVADDIDRNAAFSSFARLRGADAASFVAQADDGGAMFAIVLKGY